MVTQLFCVDFERYMRPGDYQNAPKRQNDGSGCCFGYITMVREGYIMKVLAGIVLYKPDFQRLKENIQSICAQVSEILLVDNGSIDEEKCNDFLKSIKIGTCNITIVFNKKNCGIAHALNQILKYAQENSYPWFLTLDQDSICGERLIEHYLKYISQDVGQLSCKVVDRNTGVMHSTKNFDDRIVTEIPFCITSGCLNNTSAIMQCGGFKEDLFIDGVDLDISCNLRNHNYRILCVNYEGLLHELGDGVTRNVFGHKVAVSNHQPWRNYYARRNIIYVARKYYHGSEKFKIIMKQMIYAMGTVLLEDKKYERIKANWKGIMDGLKMQ